MNQTAPPGPSAPARPVTTPARFFAALSIGAGCGGFVIAGLVLYGFARDGRLVEGLAYASGAFALATGFWLVGLLLIGGPVVWLLYAAGIGSRMAAALAGAILAFGAMLVLSKMMSPHMRFATFLDESAQMGAAGLVVGWVVAWAAYGSERTTR